MSANGRHCPVACRQAERYKAFFGIQPDSELNAEADKLKQRGDFTSPDNYQVPPPPPPPPPHSTSSCGMLCSPDVWASSFTFGTMAGKMGPYLASCEAQAKPEAVVIPFNRLAQPCFEA